MMISLPDIIGLTAGLAMWLCAIIYFLRHPRKRSPADVDIDNIMGWGNSGKVDKDKTRGKSSKNESVSERPPKYSYSGSDAVGVSKRIDLDGWETAIKRISQDRSTTQKKSSKRIDLDGHDRSSNDVNTRGYTLSRHSSSVHL
jgi:hypothetical protein